MVAILRKSICAYSGAVKTAELQNILLKKLAFVLMMRSSLNAKTIHDEAWLSFDIIDSISILFSFRIFVRLSIFFFIVIQKWTTQAF